VYGDSKGHVIMLLCGTREWPARDLISTDEHQVSRESRLISTTYTWLGNVGGDGMGLGAAGG
jgi:hypothetical protein